MLTRPEAEESCLWEEILLSDELTFDSSEVDEELEGVRVVIELPEEVEHA